MYRVITSSSNVDDYHANVDAYLNANPGYDVEYMFGDIMSTDIRFQNIFKDLDSCGYHPKNTYSQSRMYTSDTITVDVPVGTKQVPLDIREIIENYPNVTLWEYKFHNTAAKNRKLKFGIRDTKVQELRNY